MSKKARRAKPNITARPAERRGEEVAGGLEGWVARLAPEVVAPTFAFVPTPRPLRQSVAIRFVGRRADLTGKRGYEDQFVHDEIVDNVLAGSGPVAITPKIPVANPGMWTVTATISVRDTARGGRGRRPTRPPTRLSVYPATWSWRHWKVVESPPTTVTTCVAPLAPAPGVVTGIWGVLAVVGFVVALVIQRLVMSADGLHLHQLLAVSFAAIAAGIIGAKLWYAGLHLRTKEWNGWCIQGLIVGIGVVAPLMLAATGNPIGTFFDASAPGLLFGMAIGRVGCFFAGCCCGRPTASPWGVWSSSRRRIGLRRVPTQLIETGLTVAVAVAVTVAVLRHGPAGGAWFVGSLAAYTLGRQPILYYREEQKSKIAGVMTAVIAAATLLVVMLLMDLRVA